MSTIIDRRLNPRDKTIKNRQKFVQRSREQIKRAVKDSIDSGNIADIENDKARIRVKGISEPEFQIDPKTGNKKYVLPGNKKFVVGDRQEKPEEQSGGGGTQGGLGQGEDEFEFVLNKDEYLDFIFQDLELPNMIKKKIKDVVRNKPRRAGFTNQGNPSQLDVVRSLKNSIGRRIGLGRPKDKEIAELEEELATCDDPARRQEIEELLKQLRRRQVTVPWLDPVDIRYRAFVNQPQPTTKAVMICIMDVSGSMGQREKDLAKRFFFLLHMFLVRKYEKVDIIFIRHHEIATEVDEEEFFTSRESGGTVVSSALKLAREIITKRYNLDEWNVYVSQASDGDNYAGDEPACKQEIQLLLPLVQYMAYIEIGRYTSDHDSYMYYNHTLGRLWWTYRELLKYFPNLNMREVKEVPDIWKVFRELFKREDANA